jgi:glycopeptide antibiotics resistance protein
MAQFVTAYEFFQLVVAGRTFDIKDVVATIIASMIAYYVISKIHQLPQTAFK